MVCKPKNKGGLGIINLQIQNTALLLKQQHKFYSNEDIPWVHQAREAYYYHVVPHAVVLSGSSWWNNIISLADDYRAVSSIKVGNGSSALFWSDSWKNQLLDNSFPRLFSFFRDKLQSVKEFLEKVSMLDNFHLPLSIEAHQELQQMMDFIIDVSLNPEADDKWDINLNSGGFRPSKVYIHAFKHLEIHQPSCWIWRSKCNSKHKLFAWLILHDRINTKDMMLRRHWHVTDNHSCILCRINFLEDWRHLFFNCVFNTRIWNYLQIPWNPGNTMESILLAKRSFIGPCFSEIVILACWCIWKQRNGWIFKSIRPTFRRWKASFIHEVTMLKHRVKDDIVHKLLSWIDSLP
jgi:hypothetical protein